VLQGYCNGNGTRITQVVVVHVQSCAFWGNVRAFQCTAFEHPAPTTVDGSHTINQQQQLEQLKELNAHTGLMLFFLTRCR
jgi:hypothetical protein